MKRVRDLTRKKVSHLVTRVESEKNQCSHRINDSLFHSLHWTLVCISLSLVSFVSIFLPASVGIDASLSSVCHQLVFSLLVQSLTERLAKVERWEAKWRKVDIKKAVVTIESGWYNWEKGKERLKHARRPRDERNERWMRCSDKEEEEKIKTSTCRCRERERKRERNYQSIRCRVKLLLLWAQVSLKYRVNEKAKNTASVNLNSPVF